MEGQVRERRGYDIPELRASVRGGDEVEHDVLRTRRVLQNGEHAGNGAAEVGRVQRHCYMEDGLSVRAVAAFSTVAECRRFAERRKLAGDSIRRQMRFDDDKKQHQQQRKVVCECERECRWHGDEAEEWKAEKEKFGSVIFVKVQGYFRNFGVVLLGCGSQSEHHGRKPGWKDLSGIFNLEMCAL